LGLRGPRSGVGGGRWTDGGSDAPRMWYFDRKGRKGHKEWGRFAPKGNGRAPELAMAT